MDTASWIPNSNTITKIRGALIQWYRTVARDLPWRRTRDPYAIWISEIMLQQTQVDTVIPYFERFLRRFPDAESLAAATEDELMRYWEGLGYYSRARNLKRTAEMLCNQYHGIFPNDPIRLGAFPGIGPYTVGAIASIAFDIPLPAVDGNVVRVYSRLFCCSESWDTSAGKKQFASLGMALTDPLDPSSYNQAVMELGARICTPKNPQCPDCPLAEHCVAFKTSRVSEFPLPRRKTEKATFSFAVPILIHGSELLFRRRTESGPLQGLWGFPTITSESDTVYYTVDRWASDHGFSVESADAAGQIRHIFSHQVWTLHPIFCTTNDRPPLPAEFQWFDRSEAPPLPTAFRKILTNQSDA